MLYGSGGFLGLPGLLGLCGALRLCRSLGCRSRFESRYRNAIGEI